MDVGAIEGVTIERDAYAAEELPSAVRPRRRRRVTLAVIAVALAAAVLAAAALIQGAVHSVDVALDARAAERGYELPVQSPAAERPARRD